MAGKVFFRRGGMHPSRCGQSCEVNANLRSTLEALTGKRIPHQEFMFLVRAIAVARAENELQTKDRATRKDALAQLKAMLKLGDDDLVLALRGCDRMTFEAIQQANVDAISDVLWRDGVFVDMDGEEHRIPPAIGHVGQRECVPPYLPMGIAGVRDAVAAALTSIEADETTQESDPELHLVTLRTRFHPKSSAGNLPKPYQLELARECNALCSGKAWATAGTGRRSKKVNFADAVFQAAGMPLNDARLVALLKKAK